MKTAEEWFAENGFVPHSDDIAALKARDREVAAAALRAAEAELALLAVRSDVRAKMSTKDALMCGVDLLGVLATRAERGE